MTTRRRTVVGVIGAGRIGRMHTENLVRLAEAEVRAVADLRLDLGWAESLGIARALGAVDPLLADPEIEAVVIALPTSEHVGMIERAAAAGKHVFCEKPIAFEPEAIERAEAAAERAGVLVQVGFNRRFDPDVRRIRELVLQGRVGEVELVRVINRDPAPPPAAFLATSGGLFLDFTIHDFDTVRFVTGREVREVHVLGAVLIDPEIGRLGDLDTALVSLRLEGGALVVIHDGRQAHFYDQRLEVFGSQGSAEMRNRAPTGTLLRSAEGVFEERPHYSFVERYEAAFFEELRAFLSAVESGEPPVVSLADAHAAVSIARAARTSWLEGRRVSL